MIDDGKRYEIGVVVGRFQVAELHAGHRELLDMVYKKHKIVMVFLGVSSALGTRDNPLDYATRLKMIQTEYPTAIVLPIMDVPSDEEWSKTLDTLIRSMFPIGTVRLYGGRDSFLKSYKGTFDTFEFPFRDFRGEDQRKDLGKTVLGTSDFRAGVIYSTQNQYPKIYMTIDVAFVRENEDGDKEVLLGMRKRAEGAPLRFPGGFVDPTDANLEEAVKREIMEETGASAEDEPRYIGSFLIDDWRYKSENERIMTAFFLCDYTFGPVRHNEEFEVLDWYTISDVRPEEVEPAHQVLLSALKKKLKIKETRRKENDYEVESASSD